MFKIKKIKILTKLFFAVALTVLLSFSSFAYAPPNAQAASLDDLKQQQANLENQKKENKKKLDQLKNDKAKQLEYKSALDNQISTVQSQVDSFNSQISSLDNEIKNKTNEIADKQANINDRYEKLKERLCAIYMMGEASTLELLLNSKDVMDLADKMELVKAISAHDAQLIGGLKTDLAAIADQKKSIEDSRQQTADAKAQLDEKRSELSGLQKEANSVLAELNKSEKSVQDEQNRLEKEESAAANAVSEWLKNYYAQQQGSGSGNSGGYQGTGSFTWPMPGVTYISSPFGYRYHPVSGVWKGHEGVDIAGPAGTPIVAADDGKVLLSAFGTNANHANGYGNVVIIDHGNGYTTLYAHASRLAVSTGQIVKKGQVVSYEGSTGISTGPHLHFGVTKNGVWVDPMSFFR